MQFAMLVHVGVFSSEEVLVGLVFGAGIGC